MNRTALQITTALAGLGTAVSVAASAKQRSRDKLASELMTAINQTVKPAAEGLHAERAFDVNYWKEMRKKINRLWLLKTYTTKRLAERIYSSWGAWYEGGDDEAKLYGVFRGLQDKVQVSQVAWYYQEHVDKGVNLIDKLHERYDDAEVAKLLKIVADIPDYRIVGTHTA